ncbi:MAG: hypothetical protein ACR2MX_15555 [Cyclobacteriaceae bacterium]
MRSNEPTRSCCGGKRASITTPHLERSDKLIKNRDLSHPPMAFKYTGQRSLRVRGLVSGNTYHFSKPGSIVEIDPSDQSLFHGIPNLEKQ